MSAKSSSARSSLSVEQRRQIKQYLAHIDATTAAKKVSKLVANLDLFKEFEKIDQFLTEELEEATTEDERKEIRYNKKELLAMKHRLEENPDPEKIKNLIGFWKRKLKIYGKMGGTKRRKRRGGTRRKKSCASGKRKRNTRRR